MRPDGRVYFLKCYGQAPHKSDHLKGAQLNDHQAQRIPKLQKVYEMELAAAGPSRMEVGQHGGACQRRRPRAATARPPSSSPCTASPRPRDGIDYFPLSVDFNEKLYAVGRIPGSFMRREGRPSLSAHPGQPPDRPAHAPPLPLRPAQRRRHHSARSSAVDRDCSPEIAAMIGASAAVSISDIPFNGPIAGISPRLGRREVPLQPHQG